MMALNAKRPTSLHVCWRDGKSVQEYRGGWRHLTGGHATPKALKHYPVPILRTLYKQAFSGPDERRQQIKAEYDALDAELQATHKVR